MRIYDDEDRVDGNNDDDEVDDEEEEVEWLEERIGTDADVGCTLTGPADLDPPRNTIAWVGTTGTRIISLVNRGTIVGRRRAAKSGTPAPSIAANVSFSISYKSRIMVTS